ncbi:hypothetical protein SAMN05421841_2114 [Chryseobacterium wanjuense]|jgi:hypothetical protein|uniref:C1q domain-containing protein n=1 Tax=Chryseobacterium wanjuense TaxID=356305 RepID=A0A1I0QR95_9FLAO|nr:hypothetical protein [Chryseobacterium wanjuense]SEW30056.1 hypothetical protein SAMN05421841_2114 [Chryseobacterium wanjuense]
MKTKICSALLALLSIPFFAQSGWVGINTANPQANLDVNGTIKIRETPVAPALPGYEILAVNKNTGGDFQVAQVSPQLIADFVISQVNSGVSTTVYAAKKSAGISLLSLGLFPTGFRAVNFTAAERTVGPTSLFTETDHTYTVPSSGTYAVGFTFRYGTGLQAALLSNSPGIGILRTRAGAATLIDSRTFSGANLILLSLTISETSINNLYTLQAGDKLTFGLTGSSLLDAGLLGSSVGSFYVYKVSN